MTLMQKIEAMKAAGFKAASNDRQDGKPSWQRTSPSSSVFQRLFKSLQIGRSMYKSLASCSYLHMLC